MGSYYYAYTVVGCRLESDETASLSTVRGCNHAATNTKFCAECGKPMWIKQEQTIAEFLEDLDLPEGYEVITNSDGYAFIGLTAEASYTGTRLPDYDYDLVKFTVKELLGELFNEEEFDIWSVMYASV
jgi:hypothetical protein